MKTILALAIALALHAGIAAAQELGPGVPQACRVPVTTNVMDGGRLVFSRRAVRGGDLRIVAIGSTTTLGAGASGPAAAWPARLGVELGLRLPPLRVAVINKGVMRQTTQQMLTRFDGDVIAERPNLVIWEVGTAEAVRGLDNDTFFHDLIFGIDRLRAAGMDVILMDPQYDRRTAQLINFDPVLEAIGRAAATRDVPVFHRHAVMRAWVDAGQFNFEATRAPEMTRVADLVYDCLARQLAQALARVLR